MTALSVGIVSGARRVTQDALEARVRRIAAGLASFGVRPGDCVAILMRNDIAFMETTYAAQTLGAYAVPVNWHFKAGEIGYILGDCGAKVLVGHADLLAPIASDLPRGLQFVAVTTPPEVAHAYGFAPVGAGSVAQAQEYEAWLNGQSPHTGPALAAPLTMFYTSGTTGHPKGVRRPAPTADQMVAIERQRQLVMGLKPGIRSAIPGPLYHSAPNAFAGRAGRVGEVMVLMPRFDAVEMLALIERERIDTMFMVPTMFIRLLKLPQDVRRRYDTSSLKFIIHAAAPCPAETKRAMIEWWGPVINEFYGSTESSAVTFASSADTIAKPGTVGKAVHGAELRILDDEGRILPAGEIGEIFTRFAGLPDFTYHNKPDQRAAVDRDGFITSGDVGYLDEDGYLFICDRKRDMVISGGVNIYPAEIEAVLHHMPGVKDCVVFGIPDAEYGEALMAVVEPAEASAVTPDEIRTYLVRHLANYKVPRFIEVGRDLPREDSGKIFRRRLRDPYWEKTGRQI
ncbi:MAG: AMP-binding protein [Hyphomicrobiaceae bacterium]|nr:MAG: AMP-binding protein [Hyphomicrobiaceae bacterium]